MGDYYSLARNPLDGLNIIAESAPFDIWILDNDLGVNAAGETQEGYEFLKHMMNYYPDKIPALLTSCSSNFARRENIISLHANWIANGRRSMVPLGG